MADTKGVEDSGVRKSDQIDYDNGLYRTYVLGLLTLVYAISFVDRQLVVILQESIKIELELSDTQLGLLSGLTFALFYTICGVPIARWADHGTRRSIIALALGTWSLMTAISGLAQNYTQLLLARIGVGVGEAGGTPPAHSMISDMYPEEKRATAMSIYSAGTFIGMLLGFVLGGLLGQLFGWRWAFIIVGLPGVLLALIIRLSVKEPPRMSASKEKTPIIASFAQLWSYRSFRYLALAGGMQSFASYGAGNFTPSYFVRFFEMNTGQLGIWLGLIIGVFGAAGAVTGGLLVDRLRGYDIRWGLWVPAVTALALIPAYLSVYLVGNSTAALILFIAPAFLSAVYIGPLVATAHGLVDARQRALCSAILFLTLNLLGLGLGPLFVGLISDLLAPSLGVEALRYGMVAVVLFGEFMAFGLFLLAAMYLKGDLKETNSILVDQ